MGGRFRKKVRESNHPFARARALEQLHFEITLAVLPQQPATKVQTQFICAFSPVTGVTSSMYTLKVYLLWSNPRDRSNVEPLSFESKSGSGGLKKRWMPAGVLRRAMSGYQPVCRKSVYKARGAILFQAILILYRKDWVYIDCLPVMLIAVFATQRYQQLGAGHSAAS